MQDLDNLEVQAAEAPALFEAAFPRGEQVIMVHLTGHLIGQIRQWGPLRCTWKVPVEAFFKNLKAAVRKDGGPRSGKPEAVIMHSYVMWRGAQSVMPLNTMPSP